MPFSRHQYDVSIYQPCSDEGTYTLNTDTGSATEPYAVASDCFWSSDNCACDIHHWVVGGYGATSINSIQDDTSLSAASTPYAVYVSSFSTACVCSAGGTETEVVYDLYKPVEAAIVSSFDTCDPLDMCPDSTSPGVRLDFVYSGSFARTADWDLFKPADSGPNKYKWGTVTVHTSQSGLDCSACNVSERVTFSEIN